MEIDTDIAMNIVLDWRKKQINPFVKAEFMLKLMKDLRCKSYRELARRLDMSHSVVQDWIRWADLDQKEYNKMKQRGLNHTEIYRQLRNNIGKVDKIITKTKLDVELEEFTTYVKRNVMSPAFSNKTPELISECINQLNRVWSKIEILQKQSGKIEPKDGK